jgi:IrrE N-terminal-like domain
MTIDDFVSELLARCEIEHVPPIDLVHLARTLGVDEITEASLVEDGRLEHTPRYVKVLLQRGAGYHRQRFTLAHELGHLVLTDPGEFVIARRYRPRVDREERFCDAFAAALLLPRDWVIASYASEQPLLAVLRRMSERAHVSLAACLIRMNELLNWGRTLLRWRRADDYQWRLVAANGVPFGLQGAVRSAPETSAWIERLAMAERSSEHAEIPLLVHGRPRSARADVGFARGTAVALVELRGT